MAMWSKFGTGPAVGLGEAIIGVSAVVLVVVAWSVAAEVAGEGVVAACAGVAVDGGVALGDAQPARANSAATEIIKVEICVFICPNRTTDGEE